MHLKWNSLNRWCQKLEIFLILSYCLFFLSICSCSFHQTKTEIGWDWLSFSSTGKRVAKNLLVKIQRKLFKIHQVSGWTQRSILLNLHLYLRIQCDSGEGFCFIWFIYRHQASNNILEGNRKSLLSWNIQRIVNHL